MIIKKIIIILALGLGCSMHVFAAGRTDTATLGKVDPPDAMKLVVVERSDSKIEPFLGMEILVGDKITLLSKSATVQLVTQDGQRKWVKYADSPFVFTIDSLGFADRFIKIANAYDLLKDFIPVNGKGKNVQAEVSRGACGRDGHICIPAGKVKPTVKLVAGERGLIFHWVGGAGVYKIRLLMNKRVIQEVSGIENACHVTLPKHDWRPGVYTLEIMDTIKENTWQDNTLTFVDASALPSFPEDLSSADLSSEERALLQADWLARQGNGAWQLEAVQRVAPLVGRYRLADDWMNFWARGQRP